MMPLAQRERRDRAILLAYRSGTSYRAIGKMLGLSGARVQQVIHRELAKSALAGTPAGELTARLRNAIHNDGCAVEPAAVKAYYSMARLLRVPNIGVACRGELQAWLRRHGQEDIT